MRYRKLRIAWSVAWGVLAVLLVVLWVRSYWWHDLFAFQIPPTVGGISCEGCLVCGIQKPDSELPQLVAQSLYLQDHPWLAEEMEKESTKSGFYAGAFSGGWRLGVPHYFAVIGLSAIASLPWIHWRFSLRTLLIVTTLVALGLGLIVFLARK